MKHLDIIFYFGFGDGYTAEDEACYVDFSDDLYNKLKEIYIDCSDANLQSILDTEELTKEQTKELQGIIDALKEDLISVQHDNGADIDPETGEEYDFSELIIDMEINVPNDWN